MRVYWTLKSIPELSTLGIWERGRAWRSAAWAARLDRDRRWWTSLAVVLACTSVGVVLGGLIGSWAFANPLLGIILLGLPVVVLAFLWYSQVVVALVRPHIRSRG
jgi:hypothetical protein